MSASSETCSIETAPVGKPIVNIAAYKFVPLDQLPERRQELRELCQEQELKGTILLTPEGINLFMAGSRDGIDALLAHLRRDPLLAELEVKESFSDYQPFSRLLVKIKKEIIAFGVEGIAPGERTSPKLTPEELKKWLDEGRPVTLLDTRNDYEVELGTFENALPIGVNHFRDFPEAVRQLPEDLKKQPIVMFCTGGIRCEKAGPFMEREGFEQIYQLEGGILKYFEECGGAHYQGDCFVFDHRVALNPKLKETETTQCYACQHPLTSDDQQHEYYELGKSCPYCWQPSEEQPALSISDREAMIRQAATPLPGSVAYTNERPLNVPLKYHQWSLLDFVCDYHPHLGRDEWQRICEAGLIRDRQQTLSADSIVRSGQRLTRLEPDTIEPDVNADIRIIAWENDYVVFNKPAPLPMHPCGRFNRNSMTGLLDRAFPELHLRPAHRLDANTTGLVVFTMHRDVSQRIQRQFEKGLAKKSYVCRVHGHPEWSETRCEAAISSKPNELGFRGVDEEGDAAVTEFRVLNRFENGEALIEAIPVTGRTNQIRVHLWHLGFPIVGDPVYKMNQQWGEQQTISLEAPPMMLHARQLTFADPRSESPRTFESPWPDWTR